MRFLHGILLLNQFRLRADDEWGGESARSNEAFKRNSVAYAFCLELIDLSDQVGLFPLQAVKVFLELHPLLLPLIDPLLQSLDATLVDYTRGRSVSIERGKGREGGAARGAHR